MNLPLHVEVVQFRQSRVSKDFVKEIVHSYLSNFPCLTPGATINNSELEENIELREHVHSITFCDADHESELPTAECELVFHVFTLDAFGAESDTMADGTSGEEVSAADVWALPAEEFHGLWGSLVYDSSLKQELLRYVETAFEFADRGVDPHVVGWSRVVLLHGPPGTGKTSLCRALAHKLAVRLGERFPRARLLEINAHGLFSKWFSESGKLVARLFERIREVAADRRLLAVLLLDEVESLAAARRAAAAGLEPSDAVRAVNALLTQLDRLKRHPNVLVLTTSNLPGAVDVAFVDRADMKRLVPPPSARAAYCILRGCCAELMARGLVAPREPLFALRLLEAAGLREGEHSRASLRLWAVARDAAAQGCSARALRRLPFLARAQARRDPPLPAFVDALAAALAQLALDAKDLADGGLG